MDVDAYHQGEDGSEYFSVDVATVLPGDVVAFPGDVVRWDGTTYTLAFDAVVAGLRRSVDLDAATRTGDLWLLSFDTSESIGGVTYEDEDVVAYDGNVFQLHLDGDAAGIARGLGIDGLHAFSPSGPVAVSLTERHARRAAFDDEDVMLWSGGSSWQLFEDTSALSPSWGAADVDAVHYVPEPGLAASLGFGLLALALALALAARVRARRSRRGEASGRVAVGWASIALAVGVLAAPPSAFAVDGVLEIIRPAPCTRAASRATSLASRARIRARWDGVSVLTSDLHVPRRDDGHRDQRARVTVDLNGFALIGPRPARASRERSSARPPARSTESSDRRETVVRNGQVEGFGRVGILIGSGTGRSCRGHGQPHRRHLGLAVQWLPDRSRGCGRLRLHRVRQRRVRNRPGTRHSGDECRVRKRCERNRSDGRSVHSCLAEQPQRRLRDHEQRSHGVSVVESRIERNGFGGMRLTSEGSHVRGNTITENAGDGIEASSASIVESNLLEFNAGRGIVAGATTVVLNNVVRSSADAAIYFKGNDSQYRGNTVTASTTIEFGPNVSAINRGSNICNGSLVCP